MRVRFGAAEANGKFHDLNMIEQDKGALLILVGLGGVWLPGHRLWFYGAFYPIPNWKPD
jgi:hypothetical protein